MIWRRGRLGGKLLLGFGRGSEGGGGGRVGRGEKVGVIVKNVVFTEQSSNKTILREKRD